MKRLKNIEGNFDFWYKLDYEVDWINYVRIEDNDRDDPDLWFSFYREYPVFEDKVKDCPLSKRRWIIRKIKYQKLKNEDVFNMPYTCLNPYDITMDDILEIIKYFKDKNTNLKNNL